MYVIMVNIADSWLNDVMSTKKAEKQTCCMIVEFCLMKL